MALPSFLIIGAPKAATTWIADGLREHPEIFLPVAKELQYFCGGHYHRGQDWYEHHFEPAAAGQRLGEASPSYLGSPDAAERIASLIPDARLILSMRHPVDQAHSFYWHLLARGRLPRNSDFVSYFERQRPRAGYYGEHLARYQQFFSPEQMLLLVYEQDIHGNPADALSRIYAFLGVDPQFRPSVLGRRSNSKREVTAFAAVTRAVRDYKRLFPASWLQTFKRVSRGVQSRLPVLKDYQPLDPELRGRLLRQHYLDDIHRLEGLMGRDLSVWYGQ